MVGACGVPVVGLGVRAWKKGPGEERCAGGWVVVGVVGSAVCFGLAWLVTLDALLVVGEAGTQAGLGALDGAVFLVGLPGCPLLWMGVAFGGLACVLTDLDALAVWRAEGRERAEVELGGR